MMQDMQQSQYFLLIGSAMLDLPKVVDDHVANFFGAMLLRQQVLSERGRSDFGKMFVLSDCKHLLLGQAAKPNTVFERNHATRRYPCAACRIINHWRCCGSIKTRFTTSRTIALLKPSSTAG